MKRLLLSVAAVAALAAPVPAAHAQDLDPALEAEAVRIYQMLPRHSTILQLPEVGVWTHYGTDDVRDVDADIPGGKARRYRIRQAGEKAWDAAIQAPNAVPIKRGDVVHASFWARASKPPKGSPAARVPVSLQQNGEPYTQIAYEEMEFTDDWQLYSIAGESPAAYDMGGMVLNLQAAAAAQTLDMGPVFINNLGPGNVPGDVQATQPPSQPSSAPSAATGPVAIDSLPGELREDLRALLARVPPGAQLMSDPRVVAGLSYGGEERLVSDSGVPGGTALEVVTPKAQIESWHTGFNKPITMDVAKSDVLLLAVWAKGLEAKNESQTASLQPIRVQQSGEPYTMAGAGAAYLSRDWDLYYLPIEASDGFPAGPAGITYHLGLSAQTVRIGPTYLLKFPAGTDPRALPKNEINYSGRENGAAWRAEAMSRIDQHRKADIVVTGTPGAQVSVRQLSHAFAFGSFTGHDWGPGQGGDKQRLYDTFVSDFSAVTLPVYWADWGWAGPGTHEDDYRRMIRHVADTDFQWRAHTVMWPGETYMPTRMLRETDPKKRRKIALDQVREVMTVLRDAEKPPFAVDLTNEPRANRYFQDNRDPTLVEDAFKLAHEIAPDLPLFINDYGILNRGGMNAKAIEYYHEWIREHLAKGVPLGGIGFQGHFASGLTPPERLIEILEDFAQYDLPLHITEFDVETLDDAAQADYTRDAILAALSVPEVEAFIFWGFWEGDHWKPQAAMLREDWSPKPAYEAWKTLVHDQLWTDTTVTLGADGTARVRGMHGRYDVSANGRSQTVTLGEGGAAVRF